LNQQLRLQFVDVAAPQNRPRPGLQKTSRACSFDQREQFEAIGGNKPQLIRGPKDSILPRCSENHPATLPASNLEAAAIYLLRDRIYGG